MKLPSFHKFTDRDSKQPKALVLNESQLMQYLAFIDSPFTISKETRCGERVSVRKYITPKVRLTNVLWLTHVFIVASLKTKGPYKYIAVYGPVMYYTSDDFDDSKYKRILAESVLDNWKIDLRK